MRQAIVPGTYPAKHLSKAALRSCVSQIVCTVLLLLFAWQAAAATDPATEGLLARWSFDETGGARVEDISGNKHHGKLHGRRNSADGVRGHSLRLDGLRNYVAVPDAEVLDFSNGTFSVTAWVNVYALRGEQQMIVAKNVYSANQREWGLMIDGDRRFRFYLQQRSQWKTVESRTSPIPGRWYHVATTLDAGRAVLYINGQQEGQSDLGYPIPDTAAPLTIGGLNDGGRLRQMLFGAVDEVCLYCRALSATEVQSMYFPIAATRVLPADQRFVLWDPTKPVPRSAEALGLDDVEFFVVKPRVPEADGYNWLHGAAVCFFKGDLYASFGHNKGSENTATEVANGCQSTNGGKTWGPLFAIDDGDTTNPAVSHGVFLLHHDRLWAFHGSFNDRMQEVHTRAYLRNDQTGRWEPKGVVAEDGFWPMQEPLKMEDGNWIMAGISVNNGLGGPDDPAAVAISHGDDLTRWDVVGIPKPKDLQMWGESTVIVAGGEVLNIARWGRPVALAAVSRDCGRTWTESRESNLPMAGSKPCGGMLSTKQRYLVGTTTADSGNRRSPLTIAVSRPGEKVFTKIFRIRDAVHSGPGESHPDCRLSYPYAVEHAGKLYVVYSNDGGRGGNRNSAELAVIPIAALRVE